MRLFFNSSTCRHHLCNRSVLAFVNVEQARRFSSLIGSIQHFRECLIYIDTTLWICSEFLLSWSQTNLYNLWIRLLVHTRCCLLHNFLPVVEVHIDKLFELFWIRLNRGFMFQYIKRKVSWLNSHVFYILFTDSGHSFGQRWVILLNVLIVWVDCYCFDCFCHFYSRFRRSTQWVATFFTHSIIDILYRLTSINSLVSERIRVISCTFDTSVLHLFTWHPVRIRLWYFLWRLHYSSISTSKSSNALKCLNSFWNIVQARLLEVGVVF